MQPFMAAPCGGPLRPVLAEGEGFEPSVPEGTSAYQADAFDRGLILPQITECETFLWLNPVRLNCGRASQNGTSGPRRRVHPRAARFPST